MAAPGAPASGNARLAGHLFTLAFIGLWALYSRHVAAYVLPGPVQVAERFVAFFGDLDLIGHMLVSFAHIGASILISFLIGTGLALLAYYVPVTRLMIHGRLSPFLNSFSGVGWTLLAVLWFGVDHVTVVFAISAVLTPFAIINMREGLENLDQELLEMSTSYTRNRWRQFWKIVVPSLYPFMFATLRISFGVSWKVTLTAELFGGNAGLGYLFNLARQAFDTSLIIVVILIIICFVYGTDRYVFQPIQARLERHHGVA
jgi:NitT/TauT family transport system permease protein/sulfonate transport system permease protein